MSDAKGGGGSGLLSDFFFFLGIIILFFFVWVASGGPSRPISFQGPYLQPITTTGEGADAYGNPDAYRGSGGVQVGGWGIGITTDKNLSSSQAGNISILPDSSGLSSRDEKSEYLTITAYSGTVSTAGWKLKSEKTGKTVALPQGAAHLQSGRVNVLAPISLSAGDTMIVVSGRSPVGVSFRENSCTGYLEERQDFKPSLSESCPTPYQEYTRFSDDDDDECINYLRTIPYCSTDTDVPSDISGSCEDFVETHLNYNGCVEGHEDDDDFYSRTWRVYLGQEDELWRSDNDTILLLDAEGKTVDSFSY